MNLQRFSIPAFFRKFSGSVLILLLLDTALSAQLNPRYLKQYTELEGVPGSQVYCVLTDRLGYIWIGSVNGLARFDGYEFKRYYNNPNDTASIQGSIIWSLFEDRKGRVWIACGQSFLNMYNPLTKSFRQYDFKHLLNYPANVELGIARISQDRKGRIYLGVTTYNGEDIQTGLLYIDENDDTVKKFVTDDKQPLHNVYSITNDSIGNTWLLSYSGFFKIDTARKLSKINNLTKKFAETNEYPSTVKVDNNGHPWIITNSSILWEFNPVDSTYKNYMPPGVFEQNFITNTITFDKKGNIWMGTNKGLLSFNTGTHQFETFKSESPTRIENAAIRDMSFDSFGSLWMATNEEGVLKYEERTLFKSYSFNKDDKASITPGWANTIYETHDGKIWISTSGPSYSGGINELNLQSNTIRPVPYLTLKDSIWGVNGMYENAAGELILNSNVGNFVYSIKNNRVTRTEFPGVPVMVSINQFYNDSQDNLWLCTTTGLYKRSKGSDTFNHYALIGISGGDASSNEITHAIESKIHGLWLTTNNGLFLYKYSSDKIERHGFDKKAGDIFITQDINSLHENPDGNVWVGTWQGGLSKYNVETKKIKTFTRNDGLPSMSVQGILGDEKNNSLWLSTFEGLSRFDLATSQFTNFSISDGIQSQLFADGSALKTPEGRFVFGGSNGITVFNATDINRNSIPPKVFLTDLKLFDKPVIPGDKSILKTAIYDTKEIVLEHNQNNISLAFIAIQYSNPSKNKYAFKLENYDNEWHETTNQHEAFYPNLPPGNYLFRVKAANSNGVWNEQGATLSILVKAPWWKTTWAYIAYFFVFAGLAFAADRYLRHRLVEKERERNRARELEQAKEIEKAYYSLAQTHETLKSTQSQLIQSEKMASLGELTAGIAHEIQNPLNFVNNFSEVSNELLDEMKTELVNDNKKDALVIAGDVKHNLEKIIYHGKRADAIVKGMLQHSRSSNAVKEPTDINALADEYLRLSYHGLRAKDNSFNASIITNFDPTVGHIDVIPQDIGRVLLNLYNNAFYAASLFPEGGFREPGGKHTPTVWVSTKKTDDKILISVRDNGSGIPQKIVDKIFQPFFTTKPTGQGTGLGLSLSYDIIKANGGEINVETKEGEGSEFSISIPFNK